MRYWTEINFSGHILLFEQKVELEKKATKNVEFQRQHI